MTTISKPWLSAAIEAGRQIPAWIAQRAATAEEFEQLMLLRERAFPVTKPGGKLNPRRTAKQESGQ